MKLINMSSGPGSPDGPAIFPPNVLPIYRLHSSKTPQSSQSDSSVESNVDEDHKYYAS